MIHHVQLACPAGSENTLRDFYSGVLGFEEVAKPPALAARGGCWFRGHGIELHPGVEHGFPPGRGPASRRPRRPHRGLPVMTWTPGPPGCAPQALRSTSTTISRGCAVSTARTRMETGWNSSNLSLRVDQASASAATGARDFDDVLYPALPADLEELVVMSWLQGGEEYEPNGRDQRLLAVARALAGEG